MSLDSKTALRLQFLVRVVLKECDHLLLTDTRLFAEPFTEERAKLLAVDPDLAERVEAFVSRFSRLQDTLGDKLLPTLLMALGEKTGAAIDNLDRAERLGFILSVDEWLAMRNLRNQMVNEYVEDLLVLSSALQSAHGFVSALLTVTQAITAEVERRGWLVRLTQHIETSKNAQIFVIPAKAGI